MQSEGTIIHELGPIDEKQGRTYLLIEHTIPLVDVGDISLIFIVSFPRELALLVDTESKEWRMSQR